MAIGLKDVKKSKKSFKDYRKHSKEKLLRPWEGYEDLGTQTRTCSAQEAVKNARIIVEKNNEMIKKLKWDLPQILPSENNSSDIGFKDNFFSNSHLRNSIVSHSIINDKGQDVPELKIKSKGSIFNVFRDMLGY